MQLFIWMALLILVLQTVTQFFYYIYYIRLYKIIHIHHLYTFHPHTRSFTYYNYCKHVTKKRASLCYNHCSHCLNLGGVMHNLIKVLFRRIKDRPITNPVILYIHRSLLMWHEENTNSAAMKKDTQNFEPTLPQTVKTACTTKVRFPVPFGNV